MKDSKILEAINDLAKAVKDKKLSTDQAGQVDNLVRRAIHALEKIDYKSGPDYLLLKWGTWKSWHSNNPEIQRLMKKHDELGVSASAALQNTTDEQKKILCEIIDLIDGTIQNDWSGDYYTKEEAKKYIWESK